MAPKSKKIMVKKQNSVSSPKKVSSKKTKQGSGLSLEQTVINGALKYLNTPEEPVTFLQRIGLQKRLTPAEKLENTIKNSIPFLK